MKEASIGYRAVMAVERTYELLAIAACVELADELEPGQPLADGAVEQDVAAPADRGQQAHADAGVVGGGRRVDEHQHGRRRELARATVSGPRNSSVTARPRPTRSIAV